MLKELFESIVDDTPDIPILGPIIIGCKIISIVAVVVVVVLLALYGFLWVIHWMWISF